MSDWLKIALGIILVLIILRLAGCGFAIGVGVGVGVGSSGSAVRTTLPPPTNTAKGCHITAEPATEENGVVIQPITPECD